MQHFTRSTVSAAAWCNKCKRETQHSVSDRRLGPCLECFERLDRDHRDRERRPAPAKQAPLFPS